MFSEKKRKSETGKKNGKIQNAKINQSCDKLECNYNFPL